MKSSFLMMSVGTIVFTLLFGCGENREQTTTGMTARKRSILAQVEISVNGKSVLADFEDNPTSRALLARMPMKLEMRDLYGREMCHRFGANALPTGTLRSDGYKVGDIAYWPPAGSLVILYRQNGEQFERQHIGHITQGVEIFDGIGTVMVEFEGKP